MSQDPGYEFEEVIIKFFGQPKTPIYFASYFDRTQFEGRALLFAICVKEKNINKDKYSNESLDKFNKFEEKLLNDDVKHTTLVECIEFLSKV